MGKEIKLQIILFIYFPNSFGITTFVNDYIDYKYLKYKNVFNLGIKTVLYLK